ncbi:leucine-rich repeat-containing protein 9-like isoform X2 [Babylonia areolata]|uniref:leucine-rich repeat-containing protein 9-like isoform X2 n=1 Tax=Babylonia areolata TaxID=304850 RepID=UPI003FD431D4
MSTNANTSASGSSNSNTSSQSQSSPSTAKEQTVPTLPVPEIFERPKLSSKSNDEELLKEVCLNNGISHSKLAVEGPELEVLEMFFSGFPRLIGLHHFPNIHTMTIIGQSISVLNGLTTLTKLKELWVAECQIQKIAGLEKCVLVEKLYLYGNQISHIDNLHMLSNLQVLWLNGNNIKNIENLTNLPKLTELNLAENKIEKIGHSLDSNIYLEDLNLSGNPISSLRDLTNLVRLAKLQSLSLKDPLYSPCPVSQLCNYSTHILFHLPSLRRLDTYDVTAKHLNELAHSTVLKKKMYYNMRVKTLHRKMANLLQRLDQHKSTQLMSVPHQRLRTITYALKEIERELHEAKQDRVEDSVIHDSDTESERDAREQVKSSGDTSQLQALNTKLEALKTRKFHWERTCSDMEDYCEEAKVRIQRAADCMANRLVVELETGGNVRFEEGASTDVWFTSCHDLVMSRFCATDYKGQGVVGIKIHRIIRIHNRILRARFDKKLTRVTEGPVGEYYPGTKNTAFKKLLEYLFWIWDPEMPGGTMEPARVPEEGFRDAETHKMLGRDAAVPLSNSLSLADRHRIAYQKKQRMERSASDGCTFRFGQLIIAKTYLGKSATWLDNRPIAAGSYPKIDAVFKPRKKCLPDNDPSSACECNARQCEWYIFDHELVLPEYIIDFEYITKEPSSSPYTQVSDHLFDNKVADIPAPRPDTQGSRNDDVVLNMLPDIPQRPRMVTLTEELLLKAAKSETLSTITYLNLHGNGLSKLKHIQSLVSLKKLVVSFNELTRLDEITHMNIEYLDASFNKITTLEGMKSLSRLERLDLTWNQLHNTREELSVLRKHCGALRHLDIRHNPWLKPVALKLRVVGRIKTLKWLNGEAVTEQEGQMSLRMAAGSRISQLSLLTNSRTDTMLPRSLSLGCSAHIICQNSRLKPDKVSENDTSWYNKVTTVNLESQHMTKMSNLERLENLRWASFSNNDLTKIEGLDSCVKLEDLALDDNCIARLDGLSKLSRLRRLSLSHNQLSSLDLGGGLAHLPHLVYLAVDNNRLTSLAGLHHAQSLVELYVGNNLISNIREIFILKQLPSLVILDMYGNPMTTEADNYRLFVIYHLKTLKALDGNAVEAQEGNSAKDMFGGRLTPDFVAEKLGHATFQDVRELDLPSCSIRIVDLGAGDQFLNLRSVNLENNNLSSFSGLTSLVNLRVLCLNNNHIECVVPRAKTSQQAKQRGLSGYPSKAASDLYSETFQPVLEHLEVLHLGYNGIKDMAALQLGRLPSLKALFLQGNEITKVEGLEGLHDLRELVLDRNKVKVMSEYAFANQWNLQELHLEENRLREVTALGCLENLQRLYLGSNRIQDISELEKLDTLSNLVELSVVNNAVARRLMHRVVLVFRMPQLMIIDGIPVTDEERNKAEMYFADQMPIQQPGQPAVPQTTAAEGRHSKQNNTMVEATLPGISQYQQYKTSVPVKVTNVQLASPAAFTGAGAYYDDSEPMQRGAGRRRGQGRSEAPRTGTMSYQHLNNGGGQQGGYTHNGGSNRNTGAASSYPYLGQINPNQTAEYVEQIARMNQQRSSRR